MHDNAFKKKERECKRLLSCIEDKCISNGYTTKQELTSALQITREELDKLFRIFKDTIKERYLYKAPNRIEKDTFCMQDSTWIIIKK